MIDTLKPYTGYKDSGLPWLDAVPEHWDMVPNRALMQDQRQVVGENATDYTLLSLTLRGIIPRNMDNPKGKFPAQFNTYKVVSPEDIVFCLFDIDETPRGVGHSKLKGMITGAYDVFSPRRSINPRFLYLYYLFVDEGKLLKPLYTGLRKTIQRGVFASLKAPLPPLDEQAAIVRFLDHTKQRIDRFIRAKKKVISLLNEQKQAIIHSAVTRGLDPNVHLKPSGISWLGDIPEHWEVTRLRQVVATNPSKSESAEILRQNSLVSFLPMERVSVDGQIDPCKQVPASFVWNGLTYFRRGDVIVAKITPCFENGKGAYLYLLPTDIGFGSTEFHVLRPSAKITGHYLRLITSGQMFLKNGANVMTGSAGQQRVPTDFIKNYPIPLPPLKEQEQIFKRVSEEVSELSKIITRTEREIALLREYRTRLIADVVTGKLDVRKAAKKLPEETVESGIIDEGEIPSGDEEMEESPEIERE